MDDMIAELNRKLRGWLGYFKHADASEMTTVDGWVRMRLPSILRKRRGRKGRGHLPQKDSPGVCGVTLLNPDPNDGERFAGELAGQHGARERQ